MIPLKKQIHISGFPRSGTTLLMLMMEYVLKDAKTKTF